MKPVPQSVSVEQLETAMTELRRVMLRAKAQHLAAYNLTHSQAEVMIGLERADCTTGDIAGSLGVTSSAATQTVETLVRRGLVQRQADATDRRVVRLALTQAGRDVTAQLHAERRRQLAELIDRLTPEQSVVLVTALETLAEVINHKN